MELTGAKVLVGTVAVSLIIAATVVEGASVRYHELCL